MATSRKSVEQPTVQGVGDLPSASTRTSSPGRASGNGSRNGGGKGKGRAMLRIRKR